MCRPIVSFEESMSYSHDNLIGKICCIELNTTAYWVKRNKNVLELVGCKPAVDLAVSAPVITDLPADFDEASSDFPAIASSDDIPF